MIITKKALPRRTFLRGVGATLALPLLDAMIPAHTALAATAGNPVRRLGFMYIPMGANIAQWTPKAEPTRASRRWPSLSRILEAPASAGAGRRDGQTAISGASRR